MAAARPKKYSSKEGMVLTLKAVMNLKKDKRDLKLTEFTSRCALKGEVHEFLVANDWIGDTTKVLDDISYIGFLQFENGGLIEIGDQLLDSKGKPVGAIVGFEESHMPNHMNIVLSSDSRYTGTERGFVAKERFSIGGY